MGSPLSFIFQLLSEHEMKANMTIKPDSLIDVINIPFSNLKKNLAEICQRDKKENTIILKYKNR